MTPAERIIEVNRLLAIFNQGCSNTALPPAPATDCEECTTDVLRRIQNVAAGRPQGDEPSPALAALVAGDMETHNRIMRDAGLEGVEPMAFTPEPERGDLRLIYDTADGVASPTMQREMGDDVWAVIGPIGAHTSHPELQEALALVCMAFNRRHGRLSPAKHGELILRRNCGEGMKLLEEALHPQVSIDIHESSFPVRPTMRWLVTVEPGRDLKPGDFVIIDRETGRVRLAVSDEPGQKFVLPPTFTITPDGFLEIPR